MEDKKERSYAKEAYKSSPTGIRFNLEQERIALMRSRKKTRQQLVDFLLENYVKGENPVMERLSVQDFTKPTHNIIPVTDIKPIANTVINTMPPPKVTIYDEFVAELKDAKTIPEVEAIMKRAKGELFTPRQRMSLEEVAKAVSKDMYAD